ncbi:hypothetical protein JHW43_005140 [Diplocarpon mali]|nr:hypothetical protein JHW43_005140 [Diplocarpon mali]
MLPWSESPDSLSVCLSVCLSGLRNTPGICDADTNPEVWLSRDLASPVPMSRDVVDGFVTWESRPCRDRGPDEQLPVSSPPESPLLRLHPLPAAASAHVAAPQPRDGDRLCRRAKTSTWRQGYLDELTPQTHVVLPSVNRSLKRPGTACERGVALASPAYGTARQYGTARHPTQLRRRQRRKEEEEKTKDQEKEENKEADKQEKDQEEEDNKDADKQEKARPPSILCPRCKTPASRERAWGLARL